MQNMQNKQNINMEVTVRTNESRVHRPWSRETAALCCSAKSVMVHDWVHRGVDPAFKVTQRAGEDEHVFEMVCCKELFGLVWNDVKPFLRGEVDVEFFNSFGITVATFFVSKFLHDCPMRTLTFTALCIRAGYESPLEGARQLSVLNFKNCTMSEEALCCVAAMCAKNPVETLWLGADVFIEQNDDCPRREDLAEAHLVSIREGFAQAAKLKSVTLKAPHHATQLVSAFRHCTSLRTLTLYVPFEQGIIAELINNKSPALEVVLIDYAWPKEQVAEFREAVKQSGSGIKIDVHY